MKRFQALCLSGGIAFASMGQTPTAPPLTNPPSSARDEMKKLEALVGQWSGESWIEYGGERRTATVTETISRKQDGLLLVIEGVGRRKGPPGSQAEGEIVHDALGILFYDAAARRYVFHAYRQGSFVESEWRTGDRGYEWGFREPRANAMIRFTVDVSERNRWVETGEMSQDGASWRKFFQMTLNRTAARLP